MVSTVHPSLDLTNEPVRPLFCSLKFKNFFFVSIDVTSKFVEQYRDDQVLWAKDFGKVYTKMTYNAFDDDGKKLKLRKGKANFYHYCSRNPPNHGEKFSKVECK